MGIIFIIAIVTVVYKFRPNWLEDDTMTWGEYNEAHARR
jgi:hypothetical protein